MFEKQFLFILIVLFFSSYCFSLSTHDAVPFDEGKHHIGQWIFHLLFGIFGLLLSSLTSYLHFKVPLRPGQRIRATIGLCLTVTFEYLHIVVKTSINLYFKKFYGEMLHCQIDSAINSGLFVSHILMIVLLSVVVRKDFTQNPANSKDIYLNMILLMAYGFLIGILSVTVPGTRYFLDPSGIWCFIDFNSIVSIIIFIFLVYLFQLYYQ